MLEIAVDTLADAQVAARFADRIEFCQDLAHDGQTPDPSAVESLVRQLAMPIVSLARRGDGTTADGRELDELELDVIEARDAGADGVCFGVLDSRREIDAHACERLVRACRPARAVFHRAFDSTSDPRSALEALIALGFDRVLCAGAPLGSSAPWATRIARIAAAAEAARGRITIVACGGVRSHNAADLARLGVDLHSSCRVPDKTGTSRFSVEQARLLRAVIR